MSVLRPLWQRLHRTLPEYVPAILKAFDQTHLPALAHTLTFMLSDFYDVRLALVCSYRNEQVTPICISLDERKLAMEAWPFLPVQDDKCWSS